MHCKYDLKSLFHVLNHSSSRNNNNEINTSLKEKEATTGCAFTRKHFFPEVDITWYKTFALCYQSREKMFIWRSNSVIITWKRSLVWGHMHFLKKLVLYCLSFHLIQFHRSRCCNKIKFYMQRYSMKIFSVFEIFHEFFSAVWEGARTNIFLVKIFKIYGKVTGKASLSYGTIPYMRIWYDKGKSPGFSLTLLCPLS